MKKSILGVCVVFCLLVLAACTCEHNWQDATCALPQICLLCEETQGEALGHQWENASCDKAKMCSICGATEGEPNGHEWLEATCSSGKVCAVCQVIEGEPTEHNWYDATCLIPQTCAVCGLTEGEPLGHVKGEAVIIKEATLDELGEKQAQCSRCKEKLEVEEVFYYDITDDEAKYYKNILDTFYSVQSIHLNPESFELLGAVANVNISRTTIYVSYESRTGKEYTEYFWKEIGDKNTAIKNIFGYDNYVGTGSPVEVMDLEELWYYEKFSGYEPTISPDYDIYLS